MGYLNRLKRGISLPMSAWMRGPLIVLCISKMLMQSQNNWIDPAWTQLHWAAFEAGQLSWVRAWCLVVLGEFAQRSPHQ